MKYLKIKVIKKIRKIIVDGLLRLINYCEWDTGELINLI
jgi:hypothetical protein